LRAERLSAVLPAGTTLFRDLSIAVDPGEVLTSAGVRWAC